MVSYHPPSVRKGKVLAMKKLRCRSQDLLVLLEMISGVSGSGLCHAGSAKWPLGRAVHAGELYTWGA